MFQLFTSDDGVTWDYCSGEDDDSFPYVQRKARERSETSGKYERIVRPDLGNKIVITYKNGQPVTLS